MTFFNRITESVQLMFQRPVRCQFAALCYRIDKATAKVEILLQTSRDTGRWVIPKGWPMADLPGYGVAEQEAFEEAGVHGTVEHKPLGFFHYEKCMQEGLKIPCRVQVFALEVISKDEDFKEKDDRMFEWVSCDEAAARVHEAELKKLIQQFEKRFIG